MIRQAWILLVMLVACGAQVRGAEPTDLPASLALGEVLYHHFLGEPESAYIRASYYQKRGLAESNAREILLTQAGLALDMGLRTEADRLIDAIDPLSLAAPNRDRLHYYLARAALQRGDAQLLGEELGEIDTRSRLLKSAEGRFLLTEAQRMAGSLTEARTNAWRIPGDNVLASYALYNLGVTAWQSGDRRLAEESLSRLVSARAGTLEQALLQERGQLAIASISLGSLATNSDNVRVARRSLASITTTAHYGPAAIAALAQLEMSEGDFGAAANLWRYLVIRYPWHEASRQAHVGLAYAIEQKSGQAVALGDYRDAALRLQDRKEQLTLARHEIGSLPPLRLARALVEKDAEPDLVASLGEIFGHDEWSRWLVTSDTTALSMRLRRLGLAEANLQQRQRDLEILLDVDARRQLMIRENALQLEQNDYAGQLISRRSTLEQLGQSLLAARQSGSNPADFATGDERRLLATIDELAKTARRIAPNVDAEQRLNRLRGRVMYTIRDDLPVRIYRRQAKVEALLIELEKTENRAARVAAAAQGLGQTGSVSYRIAALDKRTNDLLSATRTALVVNGQLLIAGLLRGLEDEAASVEVELTYARLAMARIGDAQLLAAESAR